MKHIAITEKQIRFATIGLGVVGVVLVGIILFNVFKDQIVGASNTAPTNVTITQITQNSAKITWSTDRETQSVVEYGTTPTSLTFFAPESQRTKQHEVELNLLTPETTYYFQIATGDKRFSNGGVPWTFTTQGKDAQVKEKVASPSAALAPTSTVALITPASNAVSPTITPTNTPSPTPITGTPVAKDTACVASEYAAAHNPYQAKYDQNNDGTVNSADLSLCREKNITPTPASNAATPTPTTSPVPTASPTPTQTPTPTTTPTTAP